jgi:GH24 family phage-related lysozyme (muramidase)
MSIQRKTSRASIRTEVQPALSASGLTVQARPTAMAIPHGDYRPQVSADVQLISNAFNQLANVASDIGRQKIVEQRKSDMALGTQARLEAGDNAVRETDTFEKSEFFIKGYDLAAGKLGAAEASATLFSAWENNKDEFVTQGQLQKMIGGRIEEDLQGVDSPEMRAAYLETIMATEAQLTAKNAEHQALVAHTAKLDNFSAIVRNEVAVGADQFSAQDISTIRAGMRELGKDIYGLSSDEVNKIIITQIGQLAIESGRPELMDSFSEATQDSSDPEKTIPGLASSTTFGSAIAEYKEQAERARSAHLAKTKEVRQHSFLKAYEAEPNMGNRLRMLDEGVEGGLLTAEQAESKRVQLGKETYQRDLSGAVIDLMVHGQYADLEAAVANGDIKREELHKIVDKTNANLLGSYHQMKGEDPESAVYALRQLTNNTTGTGRKSQVLIRELNPPADNYAQFVESIQTMRVMEGQGAAGKQAVADHLTDETRARRQIFELYSNNMPPEEAWQMARAYGSPEALEKGRKMVSQKAANDIRGEVADKLSSANANDWVPFNSYPMGNTAMIQDEAVTFVRTQMVKSGGTLDADQAMEMFFEKFKDTHIPYKPEGSDVGTWIPMTGIDPDEFQGAMDWKSAELRAELGYGDEAGFTLDKQPGVGYVVMDSNGYLATRTVTNEDGYQVQQPVVINPTTLINDWNQSKYATEEEVLEQNANRYSNAGRRGPKLSPERQAELQNEKAAAARRRRSFYELSKAVLPYTSQKVNAAMGLDSEGREIPSRTSRRRNRRKGEEAVPQAVPEIGPLGEATPLAPEAPASEIETVTRQSIQRHEGKGKPGKPGLSYDDSEGYRTVGYGMLLEDPDNKGQWIPEAKSALKDLGLNPQDVWDGKVKLTDEQMDTLFTKSYQLAKSDAKKVLGSKQHPAEVDSIVTEMVYQMGLTRVNKFVKMREALEAGNYGRAADEMLDSKWARQTPERANELADRMRKLQ